MKSKLLAITLSAAGLASAGPALAQGLPGAANNLRYQSGYLYDASVRAGDYGFALNDLGQLRAAADRFAYTLNYQDYQSLRYAYDTSNRSWVYLRTYNYERYRFNEMERAMYEIIQNMERPLPPPPPPGPRVIQVTGQGAGGTERGNIAGCEQKAVERAHQATAQACAQQGGTYLNDGRLIAGPTRQRQGGDDYICRATVQGSCQIHGRFF